MHVPENDAVVAVDSTGIKVTSIRGGGRRARNMEHNEEDDSGIHVAVDVESKKLLFIEVTKEITSDSEALHPPLFKRHQF